MAFAKLIFSLIVACLVLPIAIVVVLAVSRMLSAMADASGGAVLERVALAGGILWAVLIICLVLAQAIHSLGARSDDRGEAEINEFGYGVD